MKKTRKSESSVPRTTRGTKVPKMKLSEKILSFSESDTLKLIHNLELHQVELESQNDELKMVRTIAEDAKKKYSELYDFAPLGYFTLSSEGEIIEIYKSGSQMLGKEGLYIKNSRFGFFVSEETKPIFNDFLHKVFNNKTKESCILNLSVNSNLPLIVHLTGIISGNGEHCLVIISDITQRVQAEELHNISETRYRRLFESAKDGILILNAETGMIVDVNPYLIEMLGYSKETFIEKEIWEIGLFKDLAANKVEFLELQQKQFVRYQDLPLETANGQKINVEFVSNVYLEGNNKVIQCNIRDMTTRKQAEVALQRSEEKFRFISENISDVVWIFNFTHDKFTYFSLSLLQLLGYTPVEAIAEGLTKLLSFESSQKLIRYLPLRVSEFLNGIQISYTDEVQFVCKDKTIKWIETVTRYHFAKDRSIEVLGVSRDISIRKLLEEELQIMNKDLQKIIVEKDKFFSIIAHDLRNPFSGFLGLTELMADKLTSMPIDEIQKTANLMRNSATNLFRLLGNLLEWSSMQRGLNIFIPVPFLLKPKVAETLVLVLDGANKKEISVNFNIPDDLVVFADVNMLEGIIRNLVSNAVKFTHPKGNITISANSVPDKSVVISIKDSGIGLNKEMLENLFRLDVSTKRKGTVGEYTTGLGLIICKDFVEKHGGKLWVESEEKIGSTFHFTLPGNMEPSANPKH